jgi:hypothetical protein
MIKTMEKNEFISWEMAQGYDLKYSRMSALIKFDDISAGVNIYDTVGRVMSELAEDDDVVDIRVHWYNGVCVLITGYTDRLGSFLIETCLYIH